MTMTINCSGCGRSDIRNEEHFRLHYPCGEEDDTVWVVYGCTGRRCENDMVAVVEMIREHGWARGRVLVHHGMCNVGLTTPNPCSCDPVEIVPGSGVRALART